MREVQAPQTEVKKPLSPLFRKALTACIPLCIVMIIIGGMGLAVLVDKHYGNYKYWLTNSAFGTFWIDATDKFPFVNAVTFNGGMLGLLLVGHNLVQDNKTRQTTDAKAQEKQKGGRQRRRQQARSKKAD